MAKTLHITNGDSTAEILRRTTLKGEILVWRELLCNGPICEDVGSDDFWMNRYAYFEKELGVSKLEYFDKTIKEIVQLEDVEGFEEIVLWFEFDLFCQVNLMALCSYLLKSFRKDITYYLVCVGAEKGKDKLQSLSDYSYREYPKLLERKIKITRHNLEFADKCWKVYVENSKEKLQKFNFKHSKFRYLQNAMEQHLKTFPAKNGLNQIQNKILEIMSSKPLTAQEIVRELLFWQAHKTVYGFGDLQYFQYLNKLKEYYVIKDPNYYLNTEGKAILNIK